MLLIYGAAAGMLVVVVVGNMIGGSGIGWTNVTTTIAGTAGLGPARQGLAAGLLTTAQQIGAAVGVSLASVVATIMPQQLGVGGHHAATVGEGAALVVALALAVAAGLLAGTPLRLTRSGAPRVAIPDRELTSTGSSMRRRP